MASTTVTASNPAQPLRFLYSGIGYQDYYLKKYVFRYLDHRSIRGMEEEVNVKLII